MNNALGRFLLAIAGFLALTAPASAITYASGAGTDNAACGAVTTPCRTLQQAATNAPAGGYVVLQGPGDFQPATISKALTIVGEKGAFVSGVSDGVALILNPVTAGVIRLRNLTISEPVAGTLGVYSVGLDRLEVDGCSFVNANLMPSHSGKVLIVNTSAAGVTIQAQGSVTSYLDNIRAHSLVANWGAGTQNRAVMVNSSIAGGVFLAGGNAFSRDVVISGGGAPGIRYAAGDPIAFLSRTTVTASAKAVDARVPVFSYGDNIIRGNGDDSLGASRTAFYR